MSRATKPRRAHKEPVFIYRPTADDLKALADEIVRELELQNKVPARLLRIKGHYTPEEWLEEEQNVTEHRRIIDLARSDPASFTEWDLKIPIGLKDFKEAAGKSPVYRRRFTGTYVARAILDRMILERHRQVRRIGINAQAYAVLEYALPAGSFTVEKINNRGEHTIQLEQQTFDKLQAMGRRGGGSYSDRILRLAAAELHARTRLPGESMSDTIQRLKGGGER